VIVASSLAPQTPTPQPAAPAVDDGGDTTLTDQVWRRLQTIFQRHQTRTSPEAVAEAEAATKPKATTEADSSSPVAPAAPIAEGKADAPSASVATATSAATGTPSGPVQRMPDTAVAAQATRVTDNAAGTTAQATALPNVEASQGPAARQVRRPGIIEMAHTADPPVTDMDAGLPAEVNEGVQSTPAATAGPPLAALDRSTEPSAQPAAQHLDDAGSARPAETAMSAATEAPAPPAAAEPARIAPAGPAEPGGLAEPLTLLEAGPTLPSAPIEHAAAPAQLAPPEQAEGSTRPAPVQARAQPVTEIRVPAPEATAPEIAASPAVTPQITPPLQDVWAVQRLPERVRTVSGAAAAPPADRDRRLPRTAPGPIAGPIADVLGRVPAGRPTQSTIEIIPPRRPRPPQRPRPVRAQLPTTMLVAETVAVPKPALSAQETAQPTMPPARATAAPQTLPARMPAARMPAAPEAVGVPSGEGAPTAPRMVETEIGALPADLWELIGETPPAPQGVPRSVPAEPHAPTTKPAPVPAARRQPPGPGPTLQRSAISTTAQAPASATATQQGDPVQTATQQAPPSETAASEPAPSETGAVAASEIEATGEPEVDVDQLAHRVYADIKRRLTVEWERTRRF